MTRAKLLLHKNQSWSILIFLFTFDNFFSYYAVTRLYGHEANYAIAYWVEKYPLLYFLCIPAEIFFIILLLRFATPLTLRFFKNQNKETVERIILSSSALYWPIGNSFLNFAFLAGHRQPAWVWGYSSLFALFITVPYAFLMLTKTKPKES